MTREQAQAEAARRQSEDTTSTWSASRRGDGVWAVVRIAIPPRKPTGAHVSTPDQAPQPDHGTPLTRAGYWSAT